MELKKSTCPVCRKETSFPGVVTNALLCKECEVREYEKHLEAMGAKIFGHPMVEKMELSPDVNSFSDATAALTINRKKQITIFTKTAGKDGQGTLMFNDAEIITAGMKHLGVVNALVFSYTSASTGKRRTAYFHLENIAGWAEDEL